MATDKGTDLSAGGEPGIAPTRIPSADVPGIKSLLGIVIGVVVIAALYLARDVLVPIMLAVLLSFLLTPLANLLRRLRIGRVPSVIVAVTIALGIIVALGTVMGSQIASLAGDVPRYMTSIQGKVSKLGDSTVGRLPRIIGRLERQIRGAAGPAAAAPAPEVQGRGTRAPIPVEVHEPAASPLATLAAVLGPIIKPIETTIIVLVVAIFFLLQREDLRDRMIRLFGSTDLHKTTLAMDDAAARLSRYFITQLGMNSAFGLVIGTGLWFIGVPSAALWGVLAALMRFIPYVGAFLAAALPLVLAAAVDPGWTMVLAVAALFVVGESVMGYVIEPMVYGHSTGLSPVSVVVAAIFWTWLWGPTGLILSTPLTLCLVVLGRHVQRLEFLDVLLGDRPALTPVESFYQRMLKGDADEALEQAEDLLKTRSLSCYYDEIAVPGLQLAAADAGRGVVDADALDRVRGTVWELIGDLVDHGDATPLAGGSAVASEAELDQADMPDRATIVDVDGLPDAWARPGAALCLSGRGPLDAAAAAMLAQLLTVHGVGTRLASVEAASRQRLSTFDASGLMMVCITYLEITGSPSHLRYLLRRLRQRLPGVPILVGLWPAGDRTMTDAQVQSIVGADAHVSTLRDAVDTCLQVANGGSLDAAAPAIAA